MNTTLNIRRTMIFILSFTWALVGFAQNKSDEYIVSQFFPQLLNNSNTDLRLYSYAVIDIERSGQNNYIIAAYSNGFSGAVRLLKREGLSAVVVAAPNYPSMGGIYPNVKLLDVDADGRPEAVVSFTTGGSWGPVTWVMKWDGIDLRSIGPVTSDQADSIDSVLNDPVFMDYFGSGQLSIIAPDHDAPLGEHNLPLWLAVYSLSNGRYEKVSSLSMFDTFKREYGAPIEKVRKFSVSNTSKKYVMTIVNGSGGENIVSSAQIELNGAIVADTNQFNKTVKVIKIPVKVNSENTLAVKLYGTPGSLLSIGIGD